MTAANAVSYRSSLRQRRFAWLFAAQTVSLAGSGMTAVALGLLAYDLAGGQATAVLGAALTLRIVAYVVFASLTFRLNTGAIVARSSIPPKTGAVCRGHNIADPPSAASKRTGA